MPGSYFWKGLISKVLRQTPKRKRCLGSPKSSTFVDQKVEPLELNVFRLTVLDLSLNYPVERCLDAVAFGAEGFRPLVNGRS